MFRTHAIVLYIQKIRDDQKRVILFSRDYGKITCWSKKNILPDMGSIVSVIIERKGSENHIKTIDNLNSLGNIFENYEQVHGFLSLMETLYRLLPDSLEHQHIYDDVVHLVQLIGNSQKRTEDWIFLKVWKIQLFTLMNIRILKRLWFLRQESFMESSILNYIYGNIEKRSIPDIARGKNLSNEVLTSLRNIILHTHYNFHYWL